MLISYAEEMPLNDGDRSGNGGPGTTTDQHPVVRQSSFHQQTNISLLREIHYSKRTHNKRCVQLGLGGLQMFPLLNMVPLEINCSLLIFP
jgi:hypothetical protein